VKKRQPIKFDYRRFGQFNGPHVTEAKEFKAAAQRVTSLHDLLLEGKDPLLKDGNIVMTGWKTESPFISGSELDEIRSAANKLASEIDDFISIGIGGSYLGIHSTIDAVRGSLELINLLPREKRGGIPRIFFLGHNMDPAYTAAIFEIIKGKRVGAVVISKSGVTVEPAIAFAIVKKHIEKNFGSDAAKRIVAVTDRTKGALKKLADKQGYKSFVVPDNVGGRFSVTCPVGLFALAVAGVDIQEFIAGVKAAEEQVRDRPFEKNISMLRAVMRFVAHKHLNKSIELASTGVYDLRSVTMWLQQLGPESEGKNGEGLLIVPQFYTRDAHADGQLVQQGKRSLIETFLMVENPGIDVTIPGKGTPVDYLDGKTLHFANTSFIEGLRDAHYEGGVPVMSYILSQLDTFTMGMFYQYEMNAIALSGLLLGQNPFIQPGVQLYKDIANARSGKPGTEAQAAEMKKAEARLNKKFIV
jgi:glucose-6-phosphate isomerase